MTEQTNQTEAHVASGVTIQIDPELVLQAILGSGRYDYEAEEEIPGGPVAHAIVGMAAKQLATELRDDVRAVIRDEVKASVERIVQTTLEEGIRPTDRWGQPTGEPVPIAAMIRKETEEWLTKPSPGDSYGRPTMMQKLVGDAVNAAWTREIKGAVEAGKAQVLAAVKAKAADVVAETVARATR